MNGLAVLLAMIAIYGAYAVKDPRLEDRKFTVWAWIICSAIALGATFYFGVGDVTVAGMVAGYIVYGMAMTFVLEEARTVHVSSPLLLVVHGMGLAYIDVLLLPALLLTPLVIYAILRKRREGLLDCVLYVWCMVVLTVYTARFISDELVRSDELSTLLLALPLLFVRLSSFAMMLTYLFPDKSAPIQGYKDAYEMFLKYSQLREAPVALVLALLVGAMVAMAFAFHVEQEGPAFVVIYGVGLAIAVRLYPDDQPGVGWWQRR